ncbi:MAG: hypothetical protein QN187_15780 [Armatimonadota bacterium]|nr:hypothetical protein [Armatimonadota bacterium]MDR7518415.1 hypothetical protein [Armatimonadota bacterium]MDR7549323.1 hypothetical protein [Armatimonadota bacterium]
MFRHVPWLLVFILGAAPAFGAPLGSTFQGDPQAVAEVQAAYQKFAAARTWRARMTSPGVAGSQTFEFVAPDRYRVVIGQGGTTTELFLIGNETWIRSGDVCRKQPSMMRVENPRDAMQARPDLTIAVSRGGAETVDGVATQTYQITVTAQRTPVRQKLYVATSTGLPHRLELQSERGPVLIDYPDYDAQITINNPPC